MPCVCGARQVRHRRLDTYVRGPVCRACGRRNTLRPDKWMNTRWSQPCGCQAYHFTHRRGSGLCFHRIFDKEAFEERAAIVEYDGGLPRRVAEEMAVIEQHEVRYARCQ